MRKAKREWSGRGRGLLAAVLLLATLLLAAGCGGGKVANLPPQNAKVCCFGDSLVAGVGVSDAATESYPAVLATLIGREVTNRGTSGDTTADGVAKLAQFEGDGERFGIIVVTLGGNDILQSRSWTDTQADLRTIFQRLSATGAVVVFTGVTGPLNPGRDGAYKTLCKENGVLYVPEILRGIMHNDELMSDPVHPNSAGYRVMAERVAAALKDRGVLP